MRTAIYHGTQVEAAEGAPREALCPECFDPVYLCERTSTHGIPLDESCWYYRHTYKAILGWDCELRTKARP